MMRGMRMRGGVKPQDVGQTIRRLMSYVGRYRLRLMLVVLCIILSAVASVLSSTFIGVLIDDYISPLLLQANPVFTGLARALGVMVCVYVVGMISGYFYNRLMVTVAQGVLKDVRDEMFAHMQTLPIRYFDTHSHGEVMSHFTNDTDTLRQMIAQALPQVLSSVVSLVAVVCAMLSLSLWLTLFVLAFSMYNPDSMLYSLIMIFVYSKVMDYVSTIFNQRKMVLIISTQHAAIREDILTHLHRGATLLSGSGGFTGEQRPVLLTVVQNYQIRLLEELIFRHDKQAFVIIENTLNVLGKGFSCVKEYK